MSCPHKHQIRPGLPPMPERIAQLPVDPERLYPVPFFVAWVEGKPEFRAMDGAKWVKCVKEKLCWVCGQSMGAHKAFTIGPMCTINRVTAEPPAHLECAEWSVKACPFLSRPNMVRREDEFTDSLKGNIAGISSDANPGTTCIWTTKTFEIFRDPKRRPLIAVGDPTSMSWWKEGRPATTEEVREALMTGYERIVKLTFTDEDRQVLIKNRDKMLATLIEKAKP